MRATELPPPTQQNCCSNRPHHLLPSLKELCACCGPDRGTKWTRGRRTSCSLLCSQVVCVPSAAAGTLGEAERRPWVLTRLRGTRHRQVADPYSAVLDSALRQLGRKESTRDGPSNTERHSRGNPVTKSSHSGLKVKEGGFPGGGLLKRLRQRLKRRVKEDSRPIPHSVSQQVPSFSHSRVYYVRSHLCRQIAASASRCSLPCTGRPTRKHAPWGQGTEEGDRSDLDPPGSGACVFSWFL